MPTTKVIFSAEQAAAALWTYGEDELAERALAIPDEDLGPLWQWAGAHWRAAHGLPLAGRLVLDKLMAFAVMHYLEGRLRPLTQERRRPASRMPERLKQARAPGGA